MNDTAKQLDNVKKLPRAMIKTGDELTKCPPKVTRMAIKGWELKQSIDTLKDELDTLNQQLAHAVGTGSTVWVDNEVLVPVALRQTLTITDADALRGALGVRFNDLVEEKVTYKITQRLKGILADGDDNTGNKAREYIDTAYSTTVSYRGGKPLPKAITHKAA